jgi:hypothetical protein
LADATAAILYAYLENRAVTSPEISVNLYQTTRRHIPEDSNCNSALFATLHVSQDHVTNVVAS